MQEPIPQRPFLERMSKVLFLAAFVGACLSLAPIAALADTYSCPADRIATVTHYCVGKEGKLATYFQKRWWDFVERRGLYVNLRPAGGGSSYFVPENTLDTAVDADPARALEFKITTFFGGIWESNYLALYTLNAQSPLQLSELAERVGADQRDLKYFIRRLTEATDNAYFTEPWITTNQGWYWITNTGRQAFQYIAAHPELIKKDSYGGDR